MTTFESPNEFASGPQDENTQLSGLADLCDLIKTLTPGQSNRAGSLGFRACLFWIFRRDYITEVRRMRGLKSRCVK